MKIKNEYLIETPKSFDEFKNFLFEHVIINKKAEISYELDIYPYEIIINIPVNNFFKYSLKRYDSEYSGIHIKDLIEDVETSIRLFKNNKKRISFTRYTTHFKRIHEKLKKENNNEE